MPKVMETTVYTINELDSRAREYAINNIREGIDVTDSVRELLVNSLQELGYPIDDVRWSLSYCQGDGVAFYGRIENLEKLAKTVGVEIPEDEQLDIVRNPFGYHYSHWNTMDLLQNGDLDNTVMTVLSDHIKSTSKDLERKGYELIDKLTSDDECIELAEADEMLFLASGRRYLS